jgi:hypothetical protein
VSTPAFLVRTASAGSILQGRCETVLSYSSRPSGRRAAKVAGKGRSVPTEAEPREKAVQLLSGQRWGNKTGEIWSNPVRYCEPQ